MSKSNSKEELLKKLEEIQNEYDSKKQKNESQPQKYERISYDAPTDDEINKLAKESIEATYGSKKDGMQKSYNEKKLSLTEKIERAMKEADEEKQASEKRFSDSKSNVENQALKRGVQRSSIVLGELGKLESEKNGEQAKIEADLKADVSETEKQLADLSEQLTEALNKLDMEKAIAVNEKIEKLKSERESKKNEAIKYNNSISEKESKEAKNAEKEAEETAKKTDSRFMKKKVGEILDYYLAFSDPQEALEDFLEDEDVSSYLGRYYSYVYNVLKARG